MKSLNSLQPLGLLVLRVVLGLIFFSHGYPKLAYSAAGMQGFFVQHGLPGYFVYISGVLEVFGAINVNEVSRQTVLHKEDGYRQCTVWWRLKAFANVAKGVHAWGDMTRKGFGKPSVAALLALCLATPCLGQTARISGWGSYEAVTASQDWSTLGAQLTLTSTRGSGGWVAAEYYGRYGETDFAARLGAVAHPTTRFWFTAEAGTSKRPRSEEHTSELQSHSDLVCRLLLEKKKK